MAEKKDMDRLQEDNRRLAILALASEKKQCPAVCPEDGDLAELVDGICGHKKRKELLSHIAHCEVCYQQWLHVSSIVQEKNRENSRPGRIISIVSRKRFLTAAGAVCAVAASIMVFWATPFYRGEHQFPHVPGSFGQSKSISESGSTYSVQSAGTDSGDAAEPISRVLPLKTKRERKNQAADTGDKEQNKLSLNRSSSEVSPAPVVQDSTDYTTGRAGESAVGFSLKKEVLRENRAEKMADDAMQAVSVPSDNRDKDVDSFELFRQQVFQLCKNDEDGQEKSKKLREKARKIIDSDVHLTEGQIQVLNKVLELLDNTESIEAEKGELCNQLTAVFFHEDKLKK